MGLRLTEAVCSPGACGVVVPARPRYYNGTLTPQEYRQINYRQNNASRQIYREKHNGARGPR